jgi:hypothetical protein
MESATFKITIATKSDSWKINKTESPHAAILAPLSLRVYSDYGFILGPNEESNLALGISKKM